MYVCVLLPFGFSLFLSFLFCYPECPIVRRQYPNNPSRKFFGTKRASRTTIGRQNQIKNGSEFLLELTPYRASFTWMFQQRDPSYLVWMVEPYWLVSVLYHVQTISQSYSLEGSDSNLNNIWNIEMMSIKLYLVPLSSLLQLDLEQSPLDKLNELYMMHEFKSFTYF